VTKFQAAGCYGRLYPGWRLPYMPEFKDIIKRFNWELERQVADTALAVLNNKKRNVYPDPNESTVMSLASSALIPVVRSRSGFNLLTN
jgi:hypothetical protein